MMLTKDFFEKNSNLDDKMIAEIISWSAMPDTIQALTSPKIRPITHMEKDFEVKPLHKQREDIYSVFASKPLVPSQHSCAMPIGVYCHLLQDEQYDKWISSWIRQEEQIDVQTGEFTLQHYFVPTDNIMDTEQVRDFKRYSWHIGVRYAFGGLELKEKQYLEWIDDNLFKVADEANPLWCEAMTKHCIKFFNIALNEENFPLICREYKQQLEDTFVEYLEDWNKHLII